MEWGGVIIYDIIIQYYLYYLFTTYFTFYYFEIYYFTHLRKIFSSGETFFTYVRLASGDLGDIDGPPPTSPAAVRCST